MQTPGKKFSDLVEIEEIKDTDITVVRNETGVKKTPMQKISDYVKQKFIAWVFEDLPTEDKTIPGAFKELNSALTLVETELKSGDGNYFDSNTKSFCYKIMDSAYVLVINTGIIGGTIANGNNAIMFRNLPYTWKYDNRIPATLSTGEGILLFGKKGENVVRLGSEHRNIEVGTRICSNAIIPKNFINI